MQFTGFLCHPIICRATTFHRTSLCSQSLTPNLGVFPLRPRQTAGLPHLPQLSVTPMTMFAEAGEDDAETVELVDPASERQLTVGIEYQFEFEGIDYIMCFPEDDPVVIAFEEGDGMHEFGEGGELREMFPLAEHALADENILLKDTAYWWTVDDLGEFDSNEGKEDGTDEEGEVLADFQFKGRQYSVVQPAFPVYMIAKEGPNGFVPIDGEELERVSPFAEQMWMDNKPED